jgi:hypothetical protein
LGLVWRYDFLAKPLICPCLTIESTQVKREPPRDTF